jgi:hypothetical protein
MSNLNYIFANAEINNDAVIGLMNGKLNVYKRPKSSQWQCRFKLANGKWHSIEVANSNDLIKALELVKQAVELGELDAQLEQASGSVRKGFRK